MKKVLLTRTYEYPDNTPVNLLKVKAVNEFFEDVFCADKDGFLSAVDISKPEQFKVQEIYNFTEAGVSPTFSDGWNACLKFLQIDL